LKDLVSRVLMPVSLYRKEQYHPHRPGSICPIAVCVTSRESARGDFRPARETGVMTLVRLHADSSADPGIV
jgi:hypothetical protein